MVKMSVTEARAQFPSLIERVEKGETIVITRRGVVVAKVARHAEKLRQAPVLRSLHHEPLPDDFDAPVEGLWDTLA
jgi:prevent-host-death family protein